MKTLALALRNLLRNRRRSLATLLAMVIGAVSILLFGGYVRNIVYGMQTEFVRSGGHLQLQHRDYFLYGSGDPTAYGIADYGRVIDVIRKDAVLGPMLTVITPTLEFGGIAGNFAAGVSRTIVASGTVVQDQNAMRLWNDYGFPGQPQSLPLTGTGADAAVIGTGVARVLRLCTRLNVPHCPQPLAAHAPAGAELPPDVAQLARSEASQSSRGNSSSGEFSGASQPSDTGEASGTGQASGTGHASGAGGAGAPLELLAATTGGAPNVTRLNVVKAEGQGVKQLDDIFVSLHLAQAQRLLYGRAPPEVTAIDLQLKHTDQIPPATARLNELLATTLRGQPLSVYDFQTLNPYYGQTIGLFKAIFGFIALLIGAIVLFTVGNTMNAAVVERTVEIGTLRAIGLRRGGIRRLFVSEGVLIGIVGAASGLFTAIALAAIINHSGVTWTPPGRIDPIHLNVRVWGETSMLLGTSIGLIAVAALSAWWPARRAARLEVVEALRHV
jgi:putative ABC transport system permease protein